MFRSQPIRAKQLKPRPLVFHHPHYTHATGPFSTLVEGDWKLIRFYNDAQGAYLLYNLVEDREEQNDLAASNPEMVAALSAKLESALLEMQAEMPTPNPDFKEGVSTGKFNLKHTKTLAEKERSLFESRIQQSRSEKADQ